MAEVTNSIELIGSSPVGNAVNGAFVGVFSPNSMYCLPYMEGGMTVWEDMYQTDSIDLIGSTPVGNAVNGAFSESISPNSIYCLTYMESGMVLECMSFEGINTCVCLSYMERIGPKIKYSQGIRLAQGMKFDENGDIKISSSNKNAFFGHGW